MKAQLITLLAVCLLPTVVSNGSAAGWCYHLPTCNYTTWAALVPEHCSGARQSPVNIITADVQADPSLTAFTFTGFGDSSSVLQIVNARGKTVKVLLDDRKMSVSGGGLPGLYRTQQFHLHWGNGSSKPGSEHTVNGKQYPMELHIVNVRSIYPNARTALKHSMGLAVLAFFIEATNDRGKPASWNNLTSYLSRIPDKGDVLDIMHELTMDSLLQGVDRTKYYRYLGSLTTPPCNETVVWTVFKEPIKISQDLISLFSTTTYVNTKDDPLNTNNFRGVQPLNGRVITSQIY
ncbi:carbonic anhydrase 4-like [Astyanax mexicanus]|uniref:carbonic anhydrase 4-like n=1 Tax=Astyanax mexicanus TaxID=7994 RepID=UPI0020CB4C4C|nr:carbonic anhydrase 4-like [Astyanax mexicanus]